jgi:aminoglycoside/choline kinase family phosphotransferase
MTPSCRSACGSKEASDLRARDVTFARATTPLTPEQVAAGLDTLAELHGQTWAQPVGRHPPIMGPASESIWTAWFDELPARFATPRAFAAPVVLHDPQRLRLAFEAYRAAARRAPTGLVHGDPHIGNAYLERDGGVGFVDWQTVGIGHLAHDVNYFIVSALDVPDRRAYELDLLEHFPNELAAHGVPVLAWTRRGMTTDGQPSTASCAGCATRTSGSRPTSTPRPSRDSGRPCSTTTPTRHWACDPR